MEIHVTERATFKACRRLWYYQSREHLKRLRESKNALWLGRGYHYALAEYYLRYKQEPVLDLESTKLFIVGKFHEWLSSKITFEERLSLATSEEAELEEMITLAEGMLTGYIDTYYQKDTFEVVGVEMPLRVKIPGTKHYLVGTLDMLVRQKGKLWVVDHKGFTQFADPEDLELDDQMTAYMYLVSKVLGEVPGGAIYNQLRKKLPVKPVVLKSGKALSKDKSIDTTHALYMQAILENGFDPTDYADILAKLKLNEFYKREPIYRNKAELQTFEKHLVEEVREMTKKHLALYPSPSKDCKWRCRDYKILCKCQNEGGDIESLKDSLYIVDAERSL